MNIKKLNYYLSTPTHQIKFRSSSLNNTLHKCTIRRWYYKFYIVEISEWVSWIIILIVLNTITFILHQKNGVNYDHCQSDSINNVCNFKLRIELLKIVIRVHLFMCLWIKNNLRSFYDSFARLFFHVIHVKQLYIHHCFAEYYNF